MRRVAMRWLLPLLGCALAMAAQAGYSQAEPRQPQPERVEAKLADALEPLLPGEVRLEGYLGRRVAANLQNRLLTVDEEPLLAGFRRRPGEQAWIGEHVGKWLHAATLAWAHSGDPQLRAKLDRVVAALLATQEPDGYLGTYTPDRRFGLYPGSDWDVWVHKYDLIGLLTYYRYTGNAAALEGARRAADLLLRTFGPGRKSILAAGTHVGMAATSVLEPMVLLYRLTGDPRYLEFARYLVAAWDEPGGPRIMSTLLTEKAVHKTANGKAYEMLSNLVGLCELARATGERRFLQPAIHAWEDIVAHQLYITGSASHHEHFHQPFDLPNGPGANVGETCVTVTWIQLNAQLLRLTGEARYADEIERSYYNHLAAAQRPDGAQWCYYTALEGTKPYGPGINCCVSSGPRGMALAPELAYLKRRSGDDEFLVVNLFERSRVTTTLGGARVTVTQETEFPRATRVGIYQGLTTLAIEPEAGSATFGLQIRMPEWASPMLLRINRERRPAGEFRNGWVVVRPRRWKRGDTVSISFPVATRVVRGEHGNAGRAALLYGPFVLAYDEQRNPDEPRARAVGLTERSAEALRTAARSEEPLAFEAPIVAGAKGEATAVFVPFAEAGSGGGRYQVWLRAPGAPLPTQDSLLAEGDERRSRTGNVDGSILDGDPTSFVVTFDNRPSAEDWFEISLPQPVTIRRIVYTHGKTFHDGGWFDASAGKPRIEVRREPVGPWVVVSALEEYPATTATSAAGLRGGERFTLRLPEPIRVVAVRIVGRPACGDNPQQAFASCAELEAFPE